MADIFSMLPLLKGWIWETYYDGWIVAQTKYAVKGSPIILMDTKDEKGWLNQIVFMTDDPMTHLIYDFDRFHADATPYAMTAIAGFVKVNNMQFYLSKYDDTSSIYIINLVPSYALPYAHKIVISSTLDLTATVERSRVGLAVGKIVIIDEAEFKKSVKALM